MIPGILRSEGSEPLSAAEGRASPSWLMHSSTMRNTPVRNPLHIPSLELGMAPGHLPTTCLTNSSRREQTNSPPAQFSPVIRHWHQPRNPPCPPPPYSFQGTQWICFGPPLKSHLAGTPFVASCKNQLSSLHEIFAYFKALEKQQMLQFPNDFGTSTCN